MGQGLNENERHVLDYLQTCLESHYLPPNEELIQQTGVGSVSALEIIKKKLRHLGYIRDNPDSLLGIELLRNSDGSLASTLKPSTQLKTEPLAVPYVGSPATRSDPERRRHQQKRAVEFIYNHQQKFGSSPSYDEIGQGVGLLSKESVSRLVKALQEAGYIRRKKYRAREIVLTPNAYALLGLSSPGLPQAPLAYVPMLGEIAAGRPSEVKRYDDVGLLLPPEITGRNNVDELFLLRVDGHSMTEASVLDSDVVLVHRVTVVSNGDLIAAWLPQPMGGESTGATVKRYRREGNRVWLMPAHPAFEPIDGNRAEILGKVIALMRWPLGAP
jgi:repressor LexA